MVTEATSSIILNSSGTGSIIVWRKAGAALVPV